MKQLWAPWRLAYIESGAEENGCIFCTKSRGSDLRANLVLTCTDHTVVMLNKFPYNNGHLLLAPKRHEKSLMLLPAAEFHDLNDTLRRSIELVQNIFRPGGVNLGMNLGHCAGAGIEDHLHWHIVPRWDGDTNFMPVLFNTKVIVECLENFYDRFSAECSK